MAYLVTGGTGYIGSYVVRDLLKAGKEVVCLQRSGITPVFREVVGEDNVGKVKIIQGDVSNTLQLFDVIRRHGVNLIVHFGYAIPPASEQEPANALRVNCIGMSNLLEAVRLFGLKRLVWTSSTFALGPVFRFHQKPIGDDDAIYQPSTMYGATKALNEFMSRLYFDKFGVDSIAFRLPRTYGIGRWHGAGGVFTEFLRNAALNIPATIEDYDFTTAFLYVEDAAAIIVTACDVPTTKTRVFNAFEGDYTNRQVVETILKINPDARITLVKPEAGVVKGCPYPKVDASGVRTELGWQPKHRLEAGIRKCLNYFRHQRGLSLL